jgi:hypothetical protein
MMELAPEARRLLELTREARTPTAADKARVGRGLAGALAGSTVAVAHAGSGGAAGKATFAAALAKWSGIVLVAASGGAGYLGWRASQGPKQDATSRAALAAPVMEAPRTAPSPAGAQPDATSSSRAAEAEATARSSATPSGATSTARRPVAARAPAAKTTLPEELDLLHEAQAAWRAGRARTALELLAQHRSAYPRSELTPERDALTVLCLCATGRTVEAQTLARRFLRNAPGSPLRASVEESCAKDR